MDQFIRVGTITSIESGTPKYFTINGRRMRMIATSETLAVGDEVMYVDLPSIPFALGPLESD